MKFSNPPQYSCQEISMDWRAWQATVHGVAESDMIEQLCVGAYSHRHWPTEHPDIDNANSPSSPHLPYTYTPSSTNVEVLILSLQSQFGLFISTPVVSPRKIFFLYKPRFLTYSLTHPYPGEKEHFLINIGLAKKYVCCKMVWEAKQTFWPSRYVWELKLKTGNTDTPPFQFGICLYAESLSFCLPLAMW